MNTEKFAGESAKRPQGAAGALQVGSVLQQRYKISGVLGVGGMGSVYQARDMNFPNVTRHVAVKEMLNLASDPSLREMTLRNFEREANILAELSHPAVPKIFDYFSSKDRAYLVMEFIDGKDLEAIVNSMPNFLPFDMVRKWSTEMTDVLEYLHTHEPEPLIFRDVKPSNIMIDRHGNVRLIDFGIAKAFDLNAQKKGTMIGTEGYSPPEQYRGEASPQGDIYALGATLHHILTRRDPRLEAPFSFLERPIHDTNPNVPQEFEAIVMRALSYEPSERFTSAKVMKEAIERTSGVISISSAPAAAGAPPANGSAANGAARPAAAGAVEVDEFAAASRVKPLWTFKCEDEIRSTPTYHKGMVYVGAYDNNVYAVNATDGSFKWKYATEGGIVGIPNVDTDNNLLVFGSEDGFLHAIDLRSGKVSWTFKTNGPVRGPVNASLGHAFFGSDDGCLYAVRLNTGRAAWKYDAGTAVRSRPAVTAERIVVGTEGGELLGLDLTGAIKFRFKAKRAITSSPFVAEDIAYFGSVDGHVYAIDINNGWTMWRNRTNKPIISSPTVVGKQLFIGSTDNNLYCLDVELNGKEMWKFPTQGQIISSPLFFNNAVYFGGVDKNVYSVEPKKGKQRWTFETEGPIASAPAATDGMIFIGSTDHTLYALTP